MMCQPKKWWLGLLPLALLWLITNSVVTPKIENDLSARTSLAIKGGALDGPAVGVQGRDITVSGRAFAGWSQGKVEDIKQATLGVRLATDATQPVPEVKP